MDKKFKKYIAKIKAIIKKKVGDKACAIGVYRFTLENPDGSKEVKFYHNILTTAFFTMIMNNLVDVTPDNDMLFTHALLGSDDTAVAIGDTTLGVETYRNAVASMTSAANIAYVTAFFSQTEVTGTFKEAGIVSDGAAGADTGILASHVNIDVTKSNVQKLTIDWTLTLVNA